MLFLKCILNVLANEINETTPPEATTRFPEGTSTLYETTQMNTTMLEKFTASQMTNHSHLQTTQSTSGMFINKTL